MSRLGVLILALGMGMGTGTVATVLGTSASSTDRSLAGTVHAVQRIFTADAAACAKELDIDGPGGYSWICNVTRSRGQAPLLEIPVPHSATSLPWKQYGSGGTATEVKFAVLDDGSGYTFRIRYHYPGDPEFPQRPPKEDALRVMKQAMADLAPDALMIYLFQYQGALGN